MPVGLRVDSMLYRRGLRTRGKRKTKGGVAGKRGKRESTPTLAQCLTERTYSINTKFTVSIVYSSTRNWKKKMANNSRRLKTRITNR